MSNKTAEDERYLNNRSASTGALNSSISLNKHKCKK